VEGGRHGLIWDTFPVSSWGTEENDDGAVLIMSLQADIWFPDLQKTKRNCWPLDSRVPRVAAVEVMYLKVISNHGSHFLSSLRKVC
jgi:hypothetical protein